MAFYRDRGIMDITKEIANEGLGIGGGFIAGGLVGRQVENLIVPTPVGPSSTLGQKLLAWAANNGSKAALYVIAKSYDGHTDMTKKATEAIAGSIVFDTIMRLANNGYNPASATIGGYQVMEGLDPKKVQSLIQENSVLRTELNKALQQLAGAKGLGFPSSPNPVDAARQRKYGAMPSNPTELERQKKYGSMINGPGAIHRQEHFGFMEGSGPEISSVAAAHGML